MPGAFLHPYAKPTRSDAEYLRIVRGRDATVWDDQGNEYVDAMASLWYANVGYGRTEINDAVARQMGEIAAFHCFEPFTNTPADAVAERIRALSPHPDGRHAAVLHCGWGQHEVRIVELKSGKLISQAALDVLQPTLDDRLMKRIRNRMLRQPVFAEQLDPIIEAERKIMAAEQAALDRIELQKRLHIKVGGTVTAYERDTFADAESPNRKKVTDYWWMPYGRFKGRGFRQIHREAPWYLPSVLPHVKDEGLRRNIRKFLHAK